MRQFPSLTGKLNHPFPPANFNGEAELNSEDLGLISPHLGTSERKTRWDIDEPYLPGPLRTNLICCGVPGHSTFSYRFADRIGQREIPRQYTNAELTQDLEHADGSNSSHLLFPSAISNLGHVRTFLLPISLAA